MFFYKINYKMGQTQSTKINAYTFKVKAYASEGDFIHNDFIVLDKIFIPSINLEYHFYQKFLIIDEQSKTNYVQYLVENNIDDIVSYESTKDKVYMLKQIELDIEYVEKIKKYYELEKQRKRLFGELKK